MIPPNRYCIDDLADAYIAGDVLINKKKREIRMECKDEEIDSDIHD